MATLKKISKLKKFGVYENFSWTPNLPEFKQYNLIYGWNGTGKTTLSRLFSSLNGENCPKIDSNYEYSVLDSDGNNHDQNQNFPIPIRVFNSDFIDANVDFSSQSSKTISIILGEESGKLLKTIENDENYLKEIKQSITDKTTSKKNASKNKDDKFTEIAKMIGQVTQGAIVRNYNRTKAQKSFDSLNKKELLSDDELDSLSSSVSQEVMPVLNELSLGNLVEELKVYKNNAKSLLEKTVESIIIKRLKDNQDISDWVETGLSLHEKYDTDICEFCGGVISKDRLLGLTAHFNKADAQLKTGVDDLLESLRKLYRNIEQVQPIDQMNLYKELRSDYKTETGKVASEKKKLLESVKNFAEVIKSKKSNTTVPISIKEKEQPNISKLSDEIDSLNLIIVSHNNKTENFKTQREINSQKIENHYLSTIYDEVKNLKNEIETSENEINNLNDGIEGDKVKIGKVALEKRIANNKEKVSSLQKACGMLTSNIRDFLGRDEIEFKLNEDNTAYLLLRNGEPAKNLSDGERNAIAFIFFLTQLKDENFDIKNGIVVIDDPISSLDANSQFQAFAFLKTAMSDVNQLILLTHNFEFLKLTLYWMKGLEKQGKKTSFLMIKNKYSVKDNSRSAYLDKLDKSLIKFESEYHYLFNVVYNYESDGTIENAYIMPNIARKLLDSFLMFRVPKNCDTYNRLRELDFDENKKAAIYKFVNDQSHITGSGFDPALVPETQKNVNYILELMESTFQEHYNYLKESI
ncbi:MAG TPA: AAA family ATPase [Lactovum miscens]|uniref:AAA family ATPase n=1 Tax=Lactovum miscens TaxID=190387 RepID=UPI002EDB3B88